MTTELIDVTLTLIRELPEDASRLSLRNVEALAELHQRIGEAMEAAAEVHNEILDQFSDEVQSRPHATLAEVLPENVQADYISATRDYLDAERAHAALNGWKERAGYYSLTGLPKPPASPPLTIEGADGELLVRVA
jgi:hypothetical protein